MKVLLISANSDRINMVAMPLGLGLVAAATRRAGHEVAALDLLTAANPRAAVREAILSAQPQVIGVSVRNIDDQCAAAPRFMLEQVKTVIDECRAVCHASIVLGGAGYSIFPTESLTYLGADLGVWGDGEEAFPALLGCLERNEDPRRVAGVLRRGDSLPAVRASVDELDSAPLWDEALTTGFNPADPELWVPVQSRRGCPNDCSYCSTARIQGRAIRTRSPRLVVEQIDRLARTGFRRFYFVDNSFNIPRGHALELCCQLKQLRPRVEWRCILYPQHADLELVRVMAEAGCVEVSLGFESGCPRILKEMNKRFTPGEVRQISELLREHGIRRFGFLLFGSPGETKESVEESIDFAQSLALDGLLVSAGIRIYPGTSLARHAISEGFIGSEEELLAPRFYLPHDLDPWLRERLSSILRDH
ncbi:MAG: radical SAM protein [Candidatus Omnitrophica bacterium]|nr:radical SAM protein [Candidatus Omnitrophota bacterium]